MHLRKNTCSPVDIIFLLWRYRSAEQLAIVSVCTKIKTAELHLNSYHLDSTMK